MKRRFRTFKVSHGAWSHGIDQSESEESKILVFCRGLISEVSLISCRGFGIIAGPEVPLPFLKIIDRWRRGDCSDPDGVPATCTHRQDDRNNNQSNQAFHRSSHPKGTLRETFTLRSLRTIARRETNTAILIPFPGLWCTKSSSADSCRGTADFQVPHSCYFVRSDEKQRGVEEGGTGKIFPVFLGSPPYWFRKRPKRKETHGSSPGARCSREKQEPDYSA
jgi:hypothetical protein